MLLAQRRGRRESSVLLMVCFPLGVVYNSRIIAYSNSLYEMQRA